MTFRTCANKIHVNNSKDSLNYLSFINTSLLLLVFLPSVIQGETFHPDLCLVTAKYWLFILKLTIGFETNLHVNADRKIGKYLLLVCNLQSSLLLIVNSVLLK